MRHLAQAFFAFALKTGGLGLLLLGILDSSFLFAPLGNDLLVVAMSVRSPSVGNILYYSAMSAVGSVLGALLVDLVTRPLGAKGLERYLPPRRLNRIKTKTTENAAKALAIASVAPPPFPFTAFVMAAAALQYPRKRLLTLVGIARMVRFTVLGVLAWRFGRQMLKWSENPVFQGLILGLTLVCTIGSVVSVYGWIKRSRFRSV